MEACAKPAKGRTGALECGEYPASAGGSPLLIVVFFTFLGNPTSLGLKPLSLKAQKHD
jgi:hypothetical protein